MPTAVITGAGNRHGLGFEIARQLSATGFTVVLTSRSRQAALERAFELNAVGDVMDPNIPSTVELLVQRVKARFERVDVLINNASAKPTFLDSPSMTRVEQAVVDMNVIVGGTWRVTQAFVPLLIETGNARVVNVACALGSHGDSTLGLQSRWPPAPAFVVAQAALMALTEMFASELALSGVLVNAVCPGFLATSPVIRELGGRSVADGASGVVWAATLPADGPTGRLFRDRKELPW